MEDEPKKCGSKGDSSKEDASWPALTTACVVAAAACIGVAIWLMINTYTWTEVSGALVQGDELPSDRTWALRGQVGDFIGGHLAGLTGMASFFAIVAALTLQTRELGMQRKALRLQRDEMAGQRAELKNQTDQLALTAEQQVRAAVALEGAAEAQKEAAEAQQLQALTLVQETRRSVVLKFQADVAQLIRLAEDAIVRWSAIISFRNSSDDETEKASINDFSKGGLGQARHLESLTLEWLNKIDNHEKVAKLDLELTGDSKLAPSWWRHQLPGARTEFADVRHRFQALADQCRRLDELHVNKVRTGKWNA